MSAVICALLSSTSYVCNNQSPSFPLKATANNKQIIFHHNLHIKTLGEEKLLPRGVATISFTFDNNTQVKLLPINMEFRFPNKEEVEQFQQELSLNFKDWLLLQDELNKIQVKLRQRQGIKIDLWVISSLLGLLVGLIAMISFIAISLTIISALMLPPLGLALGLCLASFTHTCLYLNTKKEQEKLQRPIHIFNRKPPQTTAFFNHLDKITVMANEYHERGHRHFRIS